MGNIKEERRNEMFRRAFEHLETFTGLIQEEITRFNETNDRGLQAFYAAVPYQWGTLVGYKPQDDENSFRIRLEPWLASACGVDELVVAEMTNLDSLGTDSLVKKIGDQFGLSHRGINPYTQYRREFVPDEIFPEAVEVLCMGYKILPNNLFQFQP